MRKILLAVLGVVMVGEAYGSLCRPIAARGDGIDWLGVDGIRGGAQNRGGTSLWV